MLRWRLLASVGLILVLLAVFYLDALSGPFAPLLCLLAVAIAVGCVAELCFLLQGNGADPNLPLAALCTTAVVVSPWIARIRLSPQARHVAAVDFNITAAVFVASLLVLFLAKVVRYRASGGNIQSLAVEILAVSYIGLLLAVTAGLRWVAGADAGYLVLGSLVVAAKSGDTGAYTLGRLLGRAKMTPLLSPGKTWMGALGAVIASGLGAWLWLRYATPRFNTSWQPPAWYWAVAYGVAIGVAGLIGDLCESMIKRDVRAKDPATWLPGFGGLLDVLDSILYAGPVAYLLWSLLPLATWM
jgi:phosphatidate cytidylyltransferase